PAGGEAGHPVRPGADHPRPAEGAVPDRAVLGDDARRARCRSGPDAADGSGQIGPGTAGRERPNGRGPARDGTAERPRESGLRPGSPRTLTASDFVAGILTDVDTRVVIPPSP